MEKKLAIDYLRLSVTDRCNLNCIYCTPLEKNDFVSHSEVLTFEEIEKIVSCFVEVGVKKLRLTGGEPLVRKNIEKLIKILRGISGLKDIALTTNGFNLAEKAEALKKAGLNRINISLDTLRPERFQNIAGKGVFEETWNGVMSALKAKLHPVKINAVLLRGYNDDEIFDFVKLTEKYPLNIRFIEFFPTNERSQKLVPKILTGEEVKTKIEKQFGKLKQDFTTKGNGPANNFKINGSLGSIGFISSFSTDFCDSCNRLRIDSTGRVAPCLYANPIEDFRVLLRNNTSREKILKAIRSVILRKPEFQNKRLNPSEIEMSRIGG